MKPPIGLLEQLRRQVEINLCGRQVDVTEIDREVGQEPLHA